MSTHNICFFMENRRKLSPNYHQILLLNNSSEDPILYQMNKFVSAFLLLLYSSEPRYGKVGFGAYADFAVRSVEYMAYGNCRCKRK